MSEQNGFELLTRGDIEHEALWAMDAIDKMRIAFAAIQRIVGDPSDVIAQLAAMGMRIADGVHNDVDVIRERAERAGVVGELVPERTRLS